MLGRCIKRLRISELTGTPYGWRTPRVYKLSNERSQGQKHGKLNIMNCNFFGCENLSRVGNLCPTHYQQKLRGYTATVTDISEMPECAVSHCSIRATSRAEGALCRSHYQLSYRGIDPETRRGRSNGKTVATCWVEGCPRGRDSKGLCNYHARRARGGMLKVSGDLGVVLNGPCSFEGCERPYITKNLCHSHYTQLQTGRELTELRDWGKYTKGEHVCALPKCRKVAISSGLCANHKSMQTDYRLSVAELVAVWDNPVCSNPGCENTTRLYMDHDHSTGKFRALLCNGCNSALGFLKENPDRISGLREYIEQFG